MRISDWSSDVCSSDLADGHLTESVVIFLIKQERVFPIQFQIFNPVHNSMHLQEQRMTTVIFVEVRRPVMIPRLQPEIIPVDVIKNIIVVRKIGRATCRERVCQYV